LVACCALGAYDAFVRRGGESGDEVQDWLDAQAQADGRKDMSSRVSTGDPRVGGGHADCGVMACIPPTNFRTEVARMRKKTTPHERRVAEYFQLLDLLSRRPLPAMCSAPDDIHRILALRSAALLEAMTEPTELLRTGERRIARAVVTVITPEGRNALARGARAAPLARSRRASPLLQRA
jgi:hypothetical protein